MVDEKYREGFALNVMLDYIAELAYAVVKKTDLDDLAILQGGKYDDAEKHS